MKFFVKNQLFYPRQIELIATLFLSLVLTCCNASAGDGNKAIAMPATIKADSGESTDEFALRKQRITFGTAENRRHCQEYLAIEVGRCKAGNKSSCFLTDLYKAWCVAPGQNANAAVAKLPARNPDDYFEPRDGRWLTRVEYCRRLAQQPAPISPNFAALRQQTIKQNCSDLKTPR